MQLWFAKSVNRAANRFLALALLAMVLWMARLLGADIRIGSYFPHWSRLPLQFSLAPGPLIYFYVLKMTRPGYKLQGRDLLHFSPLLPELCIQALEVRDSIKTGAAAYNTLTFQQMSPVLHLAAFISVSTYLFWSFRLIERFYQQMEFNGVSDRYRYELRWLRRLLIGFGLVWLLWIPFTAVDYFYYHRQLSIQAYYPLYLFLAIIMIRIAAKALFYPELAVPVQASPILKLPTPAALKQKGAWLKKAMETNRFYQDAELTLSSLAEKLEMQPHELSRIINTALKKNFNDFINEYRVRDAIVKMQDPAYDRITLLGIAYESGFNSQTTFSRIFKQITGKSPREYKNDLEKNYPTYNLGSLPKFAALISPPEATTVWSHDKLIRNYMFKNYLKIAWRNLVRQRLFSLINISGLAVGLSVCMLIMIYVAHEHSYDRFHKNADRIFKPHGQVKMDGTTFSMDQMSYVSGPIIKQSLPVVADYMRVTRYFTSVLLVSNPSRPGQKFAEDKLLFADAGFFNFFSFKSQLSEQIIYKKGP